MPHATVGALRLDYDLRGRGEPLLLIMGLGAQKVLWPEGLCDMLAARGFAVARFDNRDVGASSRLDHLRVPSLRTAIVRWLLGREVGAPYGMRGSPRMPSACSMRFNGREPTSSALRWAG